MPRQLILAHDLGTSGDKAVLVGLEEGIVGSSFAPYATHAPVETWAEQDPRDWWEAVCATTQEIVRTHRLSQKDVAAIVFSGQMMGCLPVDRDGTPLRCAIIWADQRAIQEAQEFVERVGLARVYHITGHRVGPAYSGPKMAWLRRHEPRVFRETYKFLQAKDFVVHRLTGTWATDYSDACGTGLFDLAKKQWAQELVETMGLEPEVLPRAVSSTAIVGELTGGAAQATGLASGTPVVIGGGDGVCATAGAGVVTEGSAYVYLGSSAWLATASRDPLLDPAMRTFTWVHMDPGWYSPNGTMHNAGASLDWVRGLFGVTDYAMFEAEAAACGPGAGGLVFLPYLRGERSPHWNPRARGTFVGLTPGHGRAHIFRAVCEGVALNLRVILQALEEQGLSVPRIRVVGGGAQSRLWRRILADVLARPLELVAHPLEATAVGAAMAGAVGVGLVPSLAEAGECLARTVEVQSPTPSDVYPHLYRVFRRAYDQLVPVFEDLARIQEQGMV
ncbi:TPA: xylulokinase [Candidatus Acetothermia bacterium]|nr:xylulokinase [Candidatus Acetothermia bacterium]HAZ30512.1 xylulokinase [Candidatus Acetothermia bacterium]